MTKYPKSSKFNLEWMKKNEMGPNSVWLMEYLTNNIEINKTMKILDIGCGKAISSIFLAKEFETQIWAYDLWISPTANYNIILESNAEDLVYPIHGEAHALPFAECFFDIILSVDAYHYFGTDENYLNYILKYLKKDGIIGFISPGLTKELISNRPPAKLEKYWDPEFFTFHSIEWWKNHWEKTNLVDIISAEVMEDGWKDWLNWETDLLKTHPKQIEFRGSDIELLKADNGENLCFPKLVARKK